MVENTNLFVIKKIWWERIFLHLEVSSPDSATIFYLKNSNYPSIKLDSTWENGKSYLTLNITCVSERSF